MPKTVPNIQRIINDILKILNIVFSGGGSCPPLCAALGATLQHHLGNQLSEYQETIDALKENTYVDNLMHGGEDLNSLVKFKDESSRILDFFDICGTNGRKLQQFLITQTMNQ
jgi:hypothetical protein